MNMEVLSNDLQFVLTVALVFGIGFLLFKVGLWIMVHLTVWYRKNKDNQDFFNRVYLRKSKKLNNNSTSSTVKVSKNKLSVTQKSTGNGTVQVGTVIVNNSNKNSNVVVANNHSTVIINK